MITGFPSMTTSVSLFPLVLATTNVFPEALGVGVSRSAVMTSLLPSIFCGNCHDTPPPRFDEPRIVHCLGFFLNTSLQKEAGWTKCCAPHGYGISSDWSCCFMIAMSVVRGRVLYRGRGSSQKRRFRTAPQAPFIQDYTGNRAFGQ